MAVAGNKLIIVSTHVPYVPIQVAIAESPTRFDFEALVDTGFDGDVIAPEGTLTQGSHEPDQYVTVRLADDSLVPAALYEAGTIWLGDTPLSPVNVLAVGDEAIVGFGVLRRFTVTVEHDKRLIIRP